MYFLLGVIEVIKLEQMYGSVDYVLQATSELVDKSSSKDSHEIRERIGQAFRGSFSADLAMVLSYHTKSFLTDIGSDCTNNFAS